MVSSGKAGKQGCRKSTGCGRAAGCDSASRCGGAAGCGSASRCGEGAGCGSASGCGEGAGIMPAFRAGVACCEGSIRLLRLQCCREPDPHLVEAPVVPCKVRDHPHSSLLHLRDTACCGRAFLSVGTAFLQSTLPAGGTCRTFLSTDTVFLGWFRPGRRLPGKYIASGTALIHRDCPADRQRLVQGFPVIAGAVEPVLLRLQGKNFSPFDLGPGSFELRVQIQNKVGQGFCICIHSFGTVDKRASLHAHLTGCLLHLAVRLGIAYRHIECEGNAEIMGIRDQNRNVGAGIPGRKCFHAGKMPGANALTPDHRLHCAARMPRVNALTPSGGLNRAAGAAALICSGLLPLRVRQLQGPGNCPAGDPQMQHKGSFSHGTFFGSMILLPKGFSFRLFRVKADSSVIRIVRLLDQCELCPVLQTDFSPAVTVKARPHTVPVSQIGIFLRLRHCPRKVGRTAVAQDILAPRERPDQLVVQFLLPAQRIFIKKLFSVQRKSRKICVQHHAFQHVKINRLRLQLEHPVCPEHAAQGRAGFIVGGYIGKLVFIPVGLVGLLVLKKIPVR